MDTNYPAPARPRKLTKDELASLAQLDSPALSSLAGWLNNQLACAHCKKCTHRCEVLENPHLDMGMIEDALTRITSLDPTLQDEAVQKLAQDEPQIYTALRQCCFCGYCTAGCAVKMDAPFVMRNWREPFMRSNLMPPQDSRLVMVDNEWHLFSAYRAIYGIDYSEFYMLGTEAVLPSEVDTLLFPGCSLVSYAPHTIKTVGAWLSNQNIKWALSLDCCGSPLESAGLHERSVALRQRILQQIKDAGITRVLTICPGCGEELYEVFCNEVEIVPLPQVLLEQGGPAFVAAPTVSLPEATGVTIFDSCHDRYQLKHGTALRTLLEHAVKAEETTPAYDVFEMAHYGKNTLCCGAGGAVSSFDTAIGERRVWRVHNEALDSGAKILATVCPTCTYTLAQAQLTHPELATLEVRHYLELLFDTTIDWQEIFARLEGMWQGEYGPWLIETFYS